jgi:alpha-glucosidase
VLDLVLNHTSDQHPWFLESRSSLTNPKRDWYLWCEKKNNWSSITGGSGWKFDPTTGQYYFHMFLPEQPDLNWRNPEVRQAQLDVIRFWLDRGVDGFRLDVFNAFFKNAGFKNNPAKLGLRGFDRQKHVYDFDQQEMYPLLNEIRSLLDSYPQKYSIGETFLPTIEKSAGFTGNRLLHASFSFDFTSSDLFFPWNPGWLLKQILKREKVFQAERWPVTVMSNHDLPRAATRYSHSDEDTQARLAMALLLTLRGTAYIYYGEEIGMRDISLSRKEILDPPGQRYWPIYKGRDGCRSPMQWDGSDFAGFSNAKPWLPVHPDHLFRNVLEQEGDPASLLTFTRELIVLRKQYPALRQGDFSPLVSNSRHILAYLRQSPGQTVLVALNFSSRKLQVKFKPAIHGCTWKPVYPVENQPVLDSNGLEMTPYSVCILISNE